MSYLVFARKYRPQTFAEVLGQEAIVRTLTNAIGQKRIGQAYLFAGPRGTGKTSTARIFAKALNCGKGPTAAPCLKCGPCEEIAEGRSLDVLEIDGASNRGIDQIRSLRELAKFHPAGGKYKVYIIDEVHQITSEGFNALLKTLEEPPPHVLFILATTAAHKVPATILSRCQRFEFRRLSTPLIVGKLKGVAEREKLKIADDALLGIARAAGGSLRDAESLLDQVAAYGAGEATAEDVQALLGLADEELFASAASAVKGRDPVRLLGLVAQLTDAGADLGQWAVNFLGFIRHLLVAKTGAGALGFEDLGPEAIEKIQKLAEPFSVEELVQMAQAIAGAFDTMRRVGDPRIPLEVALVRLATAGSPVSVAELVERVERLGRRLTEQPADRPGSPAPSPCPSPSKGEGGGEGDSPGLEKIRAVWQALQEAVHRERAATAAYLSQGAPVRLEDGDPAELTVGFPKGAEFQCRALSQMANTQVVERALSELAGMKLRCRFQVMELPSGQAAELPATEASAGRPPDKTQVDPSILNSVLELFEGKLQPGEG